MPLTRTGYFISDQNAPHFITFSVVRWVDVFTRTIYADAVVDGLNYCIQHKGLEVYAWIIMPNHLHLILRAKEGFRLSDILRDFKKYTSKRIVEMIQKNAQESRKDWMLWLFRSSGERNPNNQTFQFWQQENHPIQLESSEIIEQKLNYIHHNPFRAGLVTEATAYRYSSAVDYCGGKGLVDIVFI
jgi:REP element-mobilizing transposase RayT